jgi:hypothetical protein
MENSEEAMENNIKKRSIAGNTAKAVLIILSAFLLSGCPNAHDTSDDKITVIVEVVTEEVLTFLDPSGKAEKGPCEKDSDVEVYLLDENMRQTMQSARGETREDDGSYVIKASIPDGYGRYYFFGHCFNEVEANSDYLKMTAIAHSSQAQKNINPPGRIQDILTVEYFDYGDTIGNTAASLAKAQSKVLEYFGLPETGMKFSEMSLQGDASGDGVLGMINSVIAQGRTGPEQNDYMIEIANRILIEDATLKTELETAISEMLVYKVVMNLRAKYSSLNLGEKAPPMWDFSPHAYYADLLDREYAVQGSFNIDDTGSCAGDISDSNLWAVPHVFASWIETSKYLALNIEGDVSIRARTFDVYDRPGEVILSVEKIREIMLGDASFAYNGYLGNHGLTQGTDYYIVIRRDEDFALSTGCAGGLLPFGRKLASNDEGVTWVGHNNDTPWYRNSGLRMYGVD